MVSENSEGRLVSFDELKPLPVCAVIAFAARCARRVQPMYSAGWPTAGLHQLMAIERAIAVAERAGAGASSSSDELYDIVNGAADANSYAFDESTIAAITAATANLAAGSVPSSDEEGVSMSYASAYSASHAAEAAAEVVVHAVDGGMLRGSADACQQMMRRDYELLCEASRREGWMDETPVPPEFFGLLWAWGPPEGWPGREEMSEGCELVIELDVPEDISEEDLKATVAELTDKADTLHRAHGGGGLIVKNLEVFGEAPVRVEVLQ